MEQTINRRYILSIDIDYILEPFINEVELAWSERPFYVTVEKGLLDRPISIFDRQHQLAKLIKKAASISEFNFKEIMDIYTQALLSIPKKHSDKVYFADNHDTILNHIEQDYHSLDKKLQQNTKYTIVNVDHHHDIYYSEAQAREVDLYNLVSPGDWLWYLDKTGLCDEYHWIGNDNSMLWKDICGTGAPKALQNGGHYKSLKDFRKAYNTPKFDLMYVCKSPHWTPDMYFDYFDILKDMAEKYFNKTFKQDIGYYCGGRSSRNILTQTHSESLELDKKYGKDNDN